MNQHFLILCFDWMTGNFKQSVYSLLYTSQQQQTQIQTSNNIPTTIISTQIFKRRPTAMFLTDTYKNTYTLHIEQRHRAKKTNNYFV